MRHLWSLLAGVVVAPLAWALVALGQDGSTRTVDGWLDSGRFDAADLTRPACYLAAAAIIAGLLATLRVSPLGPILAGLLLIAPYAALFVDPFAVRDAAPDTWSVFNQRLDPLLPVRNGTVALLGVLLLMAVFSGHRWRRWPSTAATTGDAADPPATDPDDPDAGALGARPPGEPAGVPAMAGVGASGGGSGSADAGAGDRQPATAGASRDHAPSAERLSDASRLGTSFRRRPAPVSPAPAAATPAPAQPGPATPAPPEETGAGGPPPNWPPAMAPPAEETAEPRPAPPQPRQAPPAESPWTAPPRTAGRTDDTTP